jgi:hypothetical protein
MKVSNSLKYCCCGFSVTATRVAHLLLTNDAVCGCSYFQPNKRCQRLERHLYLEDTTRG